MRYVVRPKRVKPTASNICRVLGATQTLLYNPANRYFTRRAPVSYTRDFLMCLPDREFVSDIPDTETYDKALRFYKANKKGQRNILREFNVKTPEDYADDAEEFVVRPFRHMCGRNFRITQDANDYDPSSEYISPLFPKTKEYRIIFVYGEPVITLLKKVPDETPSNVPWNHAAGSAFLTVNNPVNNKVAERHPDFYDNFKETPVCKASHFLGVDVMLTRNSYAVCEVNFAPALTLENNLETFKQFVEDHNRASTS